MSSYEKLGLFYLGKHYDAVSQTRLDAALLYDAKDLLTHAVCVGMTGSGKTGLGIAMIEEAAIDGIPVLAIDPKGDLANLLLTFPNLLPAAFRPWLGDSATSDADPVDARAAAAATAWQDGLAEWEQDGARIARLRAAADVEVFTPGSRAGRPLALLKSLQPPADEHDEDAAARIGSMARSLLALAGLSDVAPHDREQALLAAILGHASARHADLPWLVQQIQRPPFEMLGVLDIETFYPAKDRQALALRFNSVLAAPGFDVWLEGDPLDIGSLLYTPAGRPRIAIVSIAHLGDDQRMMVVSLLLNAVLEWTRRQTGTSSLRALLYMDEVFGYLPPVSNPPSKLPLLTLLKQARAYGVGLMLATQNPVDLDYKALSNMGTWFLGKLQTERDKARVLDGIESIAAGVDRQTLDRTLSALDRRIFFMHNVHEPEPVVFESRWTLSYLRGPMNREELRRAADARVDTPAAPATAPQAPVLAPEPTPPPPPSSLAATAARTPGAIARPVLPAGIREFFLPADEPVARYAPVLYGAARVHYVDARRGVDTETDIYATTPLSPTATPVDWTRATLTALAPDALLSEPESAATGPAPAFAPLPAPALDTRQYSTWSRTFEQWVGRAHPLRLLAAPSLKLTSAPGESERDFRARVHLALRESRDQAVEKLRIRYAPRTARLAERARKAEQAVGREQQQAGQQKMQTLVSMGATMLGALMGRRAATLSTLGRATTAARGVSRTMKESDDVARATGQLEQSRAELQALEDELQREIAKLQAADPATVPIETVEIKPKRGAVEVRLVGLAWADTGAGSGGPGPGNRDPGSVSPS